MHELALFAGAGGGLLGTSLLGWTPVCAVEIEDYPRRVLMQRQADGMLPRFPIWDDVRTFDGKFWRGYVDVITGGFPCQDISAAGKGAGLAGNRSGLWFEMLRIIDEVRPRYVFAENSPNLRTRGLATVLQGLAGLGYDARWCVLGAGDVGAPHRRKRMWILAHATQERCRPRGAGRPATSREGQCEPVEPMADAVRNGTREGFEAIQRETKETTKRAGRGLRAQPGDSGENVADTEDDRARRWFEQSEGGESSGHVPQWWQSEPDVGRVAHGVASRVDRLKGLGNGQVPRVAATAWEILTGGSNV